MATIGCPIGTAFDEGGQRLSLRDCFVIAVVAGRKYYVQVQLRDDTNRLTAVSLSFELVVRSVARLELKEVPGESVPVLWRADVRIALPTLYSLSIRLEWLIGFPSRFGKMRS